MKVNLKAPGLKKRSFDIQHAVNLLNGGLGGWIAATKADQKKIDNYLKKSSRGEEE